MGWFEGSVVLECSEEGGVRLEEEQPGPDFLEGLGFNPKTSANAEDHSRFCRPRKDPELRPQLWPWEQAARGLFPACQQFLFALL